jgi:hypothetical protein
MSEFVHNGQHSPTAHKVICVDFDATLCPWGELFAEPYPEPMPGAVRAMKALREAGYRIVIYTSRFSATWIQAEGQDIKDHAKYVSGFLDHHDIPWDSITAEKIPAVAYIDDRAIHYDGKPGTWAKIARRFTA